MFVNIIKMTTTIYKLSSMNLGIEFVFPSLNDIKLVVLDNEELLDLLLQNKLIVEEEIVSTDSKKYKTAIKNHVVNYSDVRSSS